MSKKMPLYMQVMDALKERIRSGDFEYDVPFVTEEKLTKEFGVSRITAIRALEELEHEHLIVRKRGSGSFVSDDAVNIINGEDIADPDMKIEKKNRDISLIALVLPFDIKLGTMFKCFDGINSVLNRENCFVSIYNAEHNIEKEGKILRELLERGIDGVVIYPVSGGRNFEIYNQFLIKNIPLVLIDSYIENMPMSYVVSDNFSGTRMLCEYAIKHGHKKIGFLCRARINFSVTLRERYMGYTAALCENGLDVNLDYVHVDLNSKYDMLDPSEAEKYGSQETYVAAKVIQMHKRGVTAVLCQNDWVALEVYRICAESGISVPNEMCIMGFDNQDALKEREGGDKIITVEQDFYEIGVQAGKIILKEIRNEDHNRKNVVPVKLIAPN